MTNKLIKDMDEETWRKFVAFCKIKNIKVNDQLKDVLEDFIEKNLSKLLNPKKGGRK